MYRSIFKSVFIISWAIFFWTIFSEEELGETEFFGKVYLDVFESKTFRYLGKLCTDDSIPSTCVSAHDVIYEDKTKKLRVDRALAEGIELHRTVLSMSPLKIPHFLSLDNLDTRFWEIDDGITQGTPNAFLFEGLIRHGTLDLSNIQGDVLQIGVATGGLLTYINRNYPKLKITGVDINPSSAIIPSKWFGYEKSKNSEIVITDGIEFIHKMAKKNVTYDGILIDACIDDNEPEDGLVCPVKSFFDEAVMESMTKLIGKTGVVSYNVLAFKGPDIVKSEEMQKRLNKHFKHCEFVNHHSFSNSLTCRNHDQIQDEKKIREFLDNSNIRLSFS